MEPQHGSLWKSVVFYVHLFSTLWQSSFSVILVCELYPSPFSVAAEFPLCFVSERLPHWHGAVLDKPSRAAASSVVAVLRWPGWQRLHFRGWLTSLDSGTTVASLPVVGHTSGLLKPSSVAYSIPPVAKRYTAFIQHIHTLPPVCIPRHKMHIITLYVAGCITVDKFKSVFISDLCHISILFHGVSITSVQTLDMFLMEFCIFAY